MIDKDSRIKEILSVDIMEITPNSTPAQSICRVTASNQDGNKDIAITKPRSLCVEMKRDDGFLDGSKYAYRFYERNGKVRLAHEEESCVYIENGKVHIRPSSPGKWEVKIFDCEKSYTVQMVF